MARVTNCEFRRTIFISCKTVVVVIFACLDQICDSC